MVVSPSRIAGRARLRVLAIVVLAQLCAAMPIAAQQPAPDSMRAAAQRAGQRVSAFVRVGKWITLGVAAGGAAYGFSESERADDLYAALERDCQADPDRCRARDGDAYTDADLEARYQDVLRIDRRTRQALFVSQASLLTSAILFIIDLRADKPRPDIPYDPKLRLSPAGLEVRLPVR